MRRTLQVIAAVNAATLILAAVTGLLPAWPDIHQPEITGIPLIEIAGEDISISNSLFTMWLVMAALIALSWAATRQLELIPGRLQNAIEMIVQGFADFVIEVGGRPALVYLPLFGTLFLFIVTSNWLGVVPFVGQIASLKVPTSDYHVTAGLALSSFVFYQWVGIRKLRLSYFKRFVNFSGFSEGAFVGAVMLILVGPIELISELFRIISLLLRLWGNIWGGEVSLSVISALVVVPIFASPLIALELLVGLVQALVFSVLVLVYIVLARESHDEEDHETQEAQERTHHAPTLGSQTSQEVAHA